MSYVGVVSSMAILVFTTRGFDEYTFYQKMLIFLTSQQIVIFLKYLLSLIMSSEPSWLRDIHARHAFVETKWLKGFDESDIEKTQIKGNLDDTIDVDGLNLYDLRKG